MMPIPFSEAALSADEAFKQKAALQQMTDLLERVAVGKKHRTLTKSDRRTLSQEGYAQDLVDNLVLVTQRIPMKQLDGSSYQDQVQTGFTEAAFDPSLYANRNISTHLRNTHQGCCAFCETNLAASGSELVVSLRPASIVFEQQTTVRSPYWQQAYSATNLYLACPACAEQHKSANFPVAGARNANPALEQPLLLAPYTEQPRDFIRFNPRNGAAYPFDRVAAFYLAQQQLDRSAVESLLWQNPDAIPLQQDVSGKALSAATLDQDFLRWLAGHADDYPRGQANIDCFGLNRRALVATRLAQAAAVGCQLKALDMHSTDPQTLATTLQALLTAQLQYRSLALDVVQSFLAQLACCGAVVGSTAQAKTTDPQTTAAPAVVQGKPVSPSALGNLSESAWPKPDFPLWLMSGLMYMMFEHELQINDKRRLVNLSADDSTYGADHPEKSLFIAIDWWNDANKVIKVKSNNHIWETSFRELAASRPLEVRNLFANNHLWVEGVFPPLL